MTKLIFNEECLAKLEHSSRLWIGFSGGLDSTVLLHRIAREPLFLKKITAVHINHGFSSNAESWQIHCQKICHSLGVPLITRKIIINERSNLEEKARKARYAIFREFINENNVLLLAHHLDDQAETVLLQLFRGAGIDGLSAMLPIKAFHHGHLLRPFLSFSRKLLEDYAKAYQLSWIDDESNKDPSLSRNFLRHDIIPLLKKRWPGVSANLARTASHCQNAKLQLNELAKMDYPTNIQPINILSLAQLRGLNPMRLTAILRLWFKQNDLSMPNTSLCERLISEVIMARDDATPVLQWGKHIIRRYQQMLYLLSKPMPTLAEENFSWTSFPAPLRLNNLGVLKAKGRQKGMSIPPNCKIEVRFRQGGEHLLWHGQTKSLKKLFQEWQVPPWLRALTPLIYINDQLAGVVDFAISDQFYQSTGKGTFQVFLERSS